MTAARTQCRILLHEEVVLLESLHVKDEVLGQLGDAVMHAGYLRPHNLSHSLSIKLLQDIEERYLRIIG